MFGHDFLFTEPPEQAAANVNYASYLDLVTDLDEGQEHADTSEAYETTDEFDSTSAGFCVGRI